MLFFSKIPCTYQTWNNHYQTMLAQLTRQIQLIVHYVVHRIQALVDVLFDDVPKLCFGCNVKVIEKIQVLIAFDIYHTK